MSSSKIIIATGLIVGTAALGGILHGLMETPPEIPANAAFGSSPPKTTSASPPTTIHMTIVNVGERPRESAAFAEMAPPAIEPATPPTTAPASGVGVSYRSSPARTASAATAPRGAASGRPTTALVTYQDIVIASDGSILVVGDDALLYGNTGPVSSSGAVVLDSTDSSLTSGSSTVGVTSTEAVTYGVIGGAAATGTSGGTAVVGSSGGTSTGAGPLDSAFVAYTGDRSADIAGFEDHSVLTRGTGNVVTYDDSNVFIRRDGKINANTGDTDSAGLNAIATLRSTVSAGPHCDDGCDDESIIQAEAGVFDEGDVAVDGDGHVVWSPDIVGVTTNDNVDCDDPAETNDDGCDDSSPADNGDDSDAADDESDDGDVSDPAEPAETRDEADSTRPAADNGEEPDGPFPSGSLVVGGDGIDDLSERVDGNFNVSTYDDSNVVIGGTGDVNAQIGDSDTGGTVTMDTVDSVVSGGNSR